MLNPRQRENILSDEISRLQRYASKNKGLPEVPLVQQALERLAAARQRVQETAPTQRGEEPCP